MGRWRLQVERIMHKEKKGSSLAQGFVPFVTSTSGITERATRKYSKETLIKKLIEGLEALIKRG